MKNFTGILIKSKKGKGYTAIVAEYPGIIAEGDTKEDAKRQLEENLHLMLEFKRNQVINSYNNVERFELI